MNLSTRNSLRIQSIDLLRGIIMVIMALDHTRDFFHERAILENPTDLSTTTVPLFFTRWITHFCAPVFLLLAGAAAYLYGQNKTKQQLSRFLVSRGLWLVLFELLIMSFIFSFNPFYNLIVLTVLWAIGWSMVILSLLVFLGTRALLVIGLLLIAGHNLFDLFVTTKGVNGPFLLQLLVTNSGTAVQLAPNHILVIGYAILPWTGVMAVGYAIGSMFGKNFDPLKRQKTLRLAGIGVIVLFIVLRAIGVYGDPAAFSQQDSAWKTILSFLNTTKYPPSLQFICMTIGPALIFLSYAEKFKGKFSQVIQVYGKVPFFYFAMHFLLLHILVTVVFFTTGHNIGEASDPQSPFLFRPSNFGYNLPITYLIWIIVVVLMYYPCKWFGRYKATHQKWWLSYL